MEEQIYRFILIKKVGNRYMTWVNAKEPKCAEPEIYEWVGWNKPLPDDIDTIQYKYIDGELEV